MRVYIWQRFGFTDPASMRCDPSCAHAYLVSPQGAAMLLARGFERASPAFEPSNGPFGAFKCGSEAQNSPQMPCSQPLGSLT